MYQRMSGNREIEALRQQTIEEIARYVKQHPNAPPKELQRVIGKHIIAFAEKVDKIWLNIDIIFRMLAFNRPTGIE